MAPLIQLIEPWLAQAIVSGTFAPPPETPKQRDKRLASERRAREFGAIVLPRMQAAYRRGVRR